VLTVAMGWRMGVIIGVGLSLCMLTPAWRPREP